MTIVNNRIKNSKLLILAMELPLEALNVIKEFSREDHHEELSLPWYHFRWPKILKLIWGEKPNLHSHTIFLLNVVPVQQSLFKSLRNFSGELSDKIKEICIKQQSPI